MCIGLYVKYPLLLSDFLKIEFCLHTSEKYGNIKFDGNPSSGGRVAPCGQTEIRMEAWTDRQVDMKLIVTFRVLNLVVHRHLSL
jgi:hypothetical protein